jgi:hypothetical protein
VVVTTNTAQDGEIHHLRDVAMAAGTTIVRITVPAGVTLAEIGPDRRRMVIVETAETDIANAALHPDREP